jgi:hypothetical protein
MNNAITLTLSKKSQMCYEVRSNYLRDFSGRVIINAENDIERNIK